MKYSSGAHTRFYHRFHIVRATKYRYKVLQGAMRERLRESGLARQKRHQAS